MTAWCSDWWPAAVAVAQYLTPDGKDVLEWEQTFSDQMLHAILLDYVLNGNLVLKIVFNLVLVWNQMKLSLPLQQHTQVLAL